MSEEESENTFAWMLKITWKPFLFFLLYELSAALLPAKPSLLYFKWKHGHLLLAGCCSVVKSCLTLRNPGDCSTPGFPVLHHLLELAQTHVHWVSAAIQSSCPLSSPSPPALNLSQHQGVFQWVSSSHQVLKPLEFQFQSQSFQWISGQISFRID